MNPFRFGSVVAGDYFTNRLNEIKQISESIKSGQHIILISPRRFGKASLINEVINNLNMHFLKIDMELIIDELDLANYYVKKSLSLNSVSTSGSALKKLFATGVLLKENNHIKIEDPFWKKWIYVNRDK
jgi:AAA+ ATPase superfamily predicted ATPase